MFRFKCSPPFVMQDFFTEKILTSPWKRWRVGGRILEEHRMQFPAKFKIQKLSQSRIILFLWKLYIVHTYNCNYCWGSLNKRDKMRFDKAQLYWFHFHWSKPFDRQLNVDRLTLGRPLMLIRGKSGANLGSCCRPQNSILWVVATVYFIWQEIRAMAVFR